MASAADDWAELWKVMSHHMKSADATPKHALNRLFQKRLGTKELPWLDETSAALRREQWTMDQLVPLNADITADPGEVGGSHAAPIVVVQWQGQCYRLDGRRRIYHWKKTGDRGNHAVLLLVPLIPSAVK